MNKKGFLIEVIVLIVVVVLGFFWYTNQTGLDNGLENKTLDEKLKEYLEEECVPASCCHPAECVPESEAPDCSEAICTEECAPDTMDCGAGQCELIDNKCEVVWNE